MDPWLSNFNETKEEELLLVKGGKKAEAVGAALLVKVVEGASFSYLTALDLICASPVLSCAILISKYWLSSSSTPISVRSSLSQVAFFAARFNVTYSASVDDQATVGCLLEHQLTGLPFSIKMNPDVWLPRCVVTSQDRIGIAFDDQLSPSLFAVFHLNGSSGL